MNQNRGIVFWLLPLVGLAAGMACGRLVLHSSAKTASLPRAVADGQQPQAAADESTALPSPAAKKASAKASESRSAGMEALAKSTSYSPADLESILRLPSVLHKRYALKQFFDRLAVSEFPRVLEALRSYRGILDSAAIGLLFRSWMVAAPEDAVRNSLELEGNEGKSVVDAGMRAWARKDPNAARAFVDKLPESSREEASYYIESLSSLDAPITDPRATLRQLLEETNVSSTKVAAVLFDWAKRDPAAAAREAANLKDASIRKSMLPSMVSQWATKDARSALRWIASLPEEFDRTSLTVGVARTVAQFDPDWARDIARQLPAGDDRSSVFATIAEEWVTRDPTVAVEMIRSEVQAGPARSIYYFSRFFEEWAEQDPEKAAKAYAELLPPVDQRGTPPSVSVFDPWAKRDPAAAAGFATQLPEQDRYQVLSRVAWRWCETNAAAAGEWAKAMPEGDARLEMLQLVGYAWGTYESSKVTEWIGTLPRGDGKDSAIDGFALGSFTTDPDGSLEWLRSTSNPKESTPDRVARVWEYWHSRNPSGALAWLERSQQLSPAERVAIQKKSER